MFQIGHCFLSRGGLYVATPCPCLDSSLIVVYHNCGQKHGSLHFRATVPMSLIIQPEPITRSTSVLQARGSVSTLLPLYYNFSAPAVLSSTLKTSLYQHFSPHTNKYLDIYHREILRISFLRKLVRNSYVCALRSFVESSIDGENLLRTS